MFRLSSEVTLGRIITRKIDNKDPHYTTYLQGHSNRAGGRHAFSHAKTKAGAKRNHRKAVQAFDAYFTRSRKNRGH